MKPSRYGYKFTKEGKPQFVRMTEVGDEEIADDKLSDGEITIEAATTETVCFNCNGKGHFARDCSREKPRSTVATVKTGNPKGTGNWQRPKGIGRNSKKKTPFKTINEMSIEEKGKLLEELEEVGFF